MKIIEEYPLQIENWIHLPIDKFMGINSDNGYNYILGITPEDPNDPKCCYFNVWIEKKITNETTKNLVFYAKIYCCYKIQNNYEKPTSEFFYSLIDKATYEFAMELLKELKKQIYHIIK